MNIAITIALAALAASGATVFIMRRFFMPVSPIEAIENAVAFLEQGTDAMTTKVSRPIIAKVNAIQEWGKAKGRAEAQAQVDALTAQVADLQAQLAAADSSGQVAALQQQLAEAQVALTAAQDAAADIDRRLLALDPRIIAAGRLIDNEASGIESMLDAGAAEEDPAGGVLDKLAPPKDA